MGILCYAGTEYEFDDRLLAHLQIVITVKLRLGEGFLMRWAVPASAGSGRVSLWLAPGIPISFHFRSSNVGGLNRQWVAALEDSSYGIEGLAVIPESDLGKRR